MKIYKLILPALLLTGCSDYLELNPTDRFTEATFWKTEEHANAGLTATYSSLMNVYGSNIPASLDAVTSNFYTYDNQLGAGNIARGIHDAANTAIINTRWGNAYQGIGRANSVISRVPGITMDEGRKKQVVAEAQFLRAFFYFSLWSVYGGVPLITDPPAREQGELPRNNAADIERQMLADLDAAIPVLPATISAANKGRAGKATALALKARIQLYLNNWAAAAETSKALIDLKSNALFPDYRALFMPENEGNTEILMDVQYKQPEFTHSNDIQFDQFNSFAPTQNLIDQYEAIDGKPITESALYDAAKPYENRDPRLKSTVITIGSLFKGKPVVATTYPQTGYGLKKGTTYRDGEAPPAGKVDNISDLNVVLIRYAEVLLTYAEAQNEVAGPDASVYAAVNEVRKRAGMPALPAGLSQAAMRERLRHERRIEFVGEGLYYFDLKRWKTAEAELNTDVTNYLGKVVDKRSFNPQRDYLWPVPTTALQTNPNLNQNPNYNR
ncbi:Starch-binding associating with outer membrane [Dyadobacter soli]|uniref:Starch-binding associating with outer membrane n=1 Tax=Dyadobacter soli TaxID=659014 RepID=A0A1G7VGR9_9BACT|nr:RagB/SusD family nutrient uptake outer membrane protein [Dyadobacter soli]SDG58934.1 Starch-binding associating with outer membrane [Dyadobacter soli]